MRHATRGAGAQGVGLAAALFLTLATPCRAGERPFFRDATGEAGLEVLHRAPVDPPHCLFFGGFFCEPERMSGGAAVGDVDGDGDPDLLVTRLDGPDRLFLNDGEGRFVLAERSGLESFELQSNGAAFLDVEGDGDLDLYLTVLGDTGDPTNHRNFLFLNDGEARFREVALDRGAAVESPFQRRGFSVAAGDYDGDGYVDLHVSEWLPFAASHSRLLRNRGAAAPGHFEDVTDAAGVNLQATDAFGSTFTDLDADGHPDLAVVGDFGTSRLFWNRGDGTFEDGTATAGIGSDENGMGSTFGDFDGDGDLDWFVSSIYDPDSTCDFVVCNWGYTGNRLYRNEGGRRFSDATDAAGVRDGAWGWGSAFFDYDNDGDLDLVMTNGVDFPGSTVEDAYNTDRMRLWENDGTGRMTEVSAAVGLEDARSGKGLVVFDADGDGDLDLFVANNPETSRFYRNESSRRNRWLRVETRGRGGNTEGLGARVTLETRRGGRQVREVGTSTHFLGQSERVVHFGLGKGRRQRSRVTVEWPSGAIQTFRRVRPNQTLVAVEPRSACGMLGIELLPAWLVAARRRRRRHRET